MTSASGLPAYEISNHARPGHEMPQPDLLALRRLCRGRSWRARPPAWATDGSAPQAGELPLRGLARNGDGIAEEAPLSPYEAARRGALRDGLAAAAEENRRGRRSPNGLT